jgi:hypothetical protein
LWIDIPLGLSLYREQELFAIRHLVGVMSAILEVLVQAVFEVLLYGTGRGFAMFFLPHLGIEDAKHTEAKTQRRWWSLTYIKGGRRMLYDEALQLIGLCFWVIVGLMLFFVVKYVI